MGLTCCLQLSKDDRLHQIMCDAKKLVLSNQSVIAKYPLQAYLYTILFSPQESLVRKLYLGILPSWISRYLDGPAAWSVAYQILECDNKVVDAISFSPDGALLASISREPSDPMSAILQLWDIDTGKLLHTSTMPEHYPNNTLLFFSPDSKMVAAAFYDGEIHLWSVVTGMLKKTFSYENSGAFDSQFSKDGKRLAVAFSIGLSTAKLWFWDIDSGELRNSFDLNDTKASWIALSPNGEKLAIACEAKRQTLTLTLWDIETGLIEHSFDIPIRSFSSLIFSPNGRTLVGGDIFDTFLVSLDAGISQRVFSSFEFGTFSPNGKYFVARAGGASNVQIWNCETLSLHGDLGAL